MKRLWVNLLFFMLLPYVGSANNIRIDSVKYTPTQVGAGQPYLTMTFTVVWENSWRDDYNYDAAYVFFKFKKKETNTATPEAWNHLFLCPQATDANTAKTELLDDFKDDYDYWLSPLSGSQDVNTGVYIFRKNNGVYAKDSVQMNVVWNVTAQAKQLSVNDILEGNVQVVGHAIEMVYIPRGAYRIGDGVSNKGFRKKAFPILAEYDVVSRNYKITSSNSSTDETCYLAADRVNDNTSSTVSEWEGIAADGQWWWTIDFGAAKTKRITYFGVNTNTTNYPVTFKLLGTKDPDATNVEWTPLWEGSGKDNWIKARDAYPVEKAIRVTSPGDYRAYRIAINQMSSGNPVATTIGMTEVDLDKLIDYSVLIDSPVTTIDSMRALGAPDGTIWTNGTIPASFPNGYAGFYAMKYEVSQDQYARFLNKLTYNQQNGLLNGRLNELQEGDYIFGDKDKPNHRNGIILATKIKGMPAVFACDLDGDKVPGQARDGQNVACNYMSVNDMLAYADWACLRPLSEMEYEKMCRPFYPAIPEKKSYAWGTTKFDAPIVDGLSGMGEETERASVGNANGGGALGYPLRVGAFAYPTDPGIERSGAGFWGCMDLCGNLAEMYYNVNNRGLVLVTESGNGVTAATNETSHGDGSLTADGHYNGVKSRHWGENAAHIAVRGGSYATPVENLTTSDRTWYTGVFENMDQRDSTVTFRLGRTAPTYPQIQSWLITELEATTQGANRNDFFLNTTSYMIKGNKPENPQGGLISYIWYSAESAGDWKVMEGQTNRDLFFDKYRKDTIAKRVNGLNFSFKRKAITPFTDSETSSQYTISLIANPFDAAVETFSNVNGAKNTYKVKCNWDSSIPRKWGFDKEYPGLTINQEGEISGISATMCNVVVTLECTLYEGIVYKKQVKETYRDYSYNGSYYTLKLLPGTYQLECWGANGAAGGNPLRYAGGIGGYARGNLILSTVGTYYVYVGSGGTNTSSTATLRWFNGGYNGGGNVYSYGCGGTGGGASDVRTTSGSWNNAASLDSRIIVAGGGGGGGWQFAGGYGGGSVGGTGAGTNARGGSQGGGGARGTSTGGFGTAYDPTSGSFGQGGKGTGSSAGGAGGGGGYYGGGGNGYQGGAGGGSGYIGKVSNGIMVNGNALGTTYKKPIGGANGYVRITVK